jgi:hypothetical protein
MMLFKFGPRLVNTNGHMTSIKHQVHRVTAAEVLCVQWVKKKVVKKPPLELFRSRKNSRGVGRAPVERNSLMFVDGRWIEDTGRGGAGRGISSSYMYTRPRACPYYVTVQLLLTYMHE